MPLRVLKLNKNDNLLKKTKESIQEMCQKANSPGKVDKFIKYK